MKNQEQSNWDLILSKYISIWIWSILFGATASMTYRMINILPSGRDWGVLSIGFGVILIYGLLFLFMSWTSLYKYLDKYIIPKFFPRTDKEEEQEDSKGEPEEELNSHAIYLKKAFKYLIWAALIMVAVEIAELILTSFRI